MLKNKFYYDSNRIIAPIDSGSPKLKLRSRGKSGMIQSRN